MALVEICNSTFDHQPLVSFGKKYYRMMRKETRICEECIDAYINEASAKLTEYIRKAFTNCVHSDVGSAKEFTLQFPVEVDEYMHYILPTVFSLKMICTSSMNIEIEPCPCDDAFTGPKFLCKLTVTTESTDAIIRTYIAQRLREYILSTFELIPDIEVQILMDNFGKATYSSHSCNCASEQRCNKCSIGIGSESYFYKNKYYCLDCMYNVIVKIAEEYNITKDVGIITDEFTFKHAVVNTSEYKRTKISKFCTVMTSLGMNPNIKHYRTTITG